MRLGEPDASGRRRPVPVEGSEFIQNCDYCISAIGQSPILDGIDPGDESMPAVSKWNTLVANGLDYATRVPGVFAGGDVVTGPSRGHRLHRHRPARFALDPGLPDGRRTPAGSICAMK